MKTNVLSGVAATLLCIGIALPAKASVVYTDKNISNAGAVLTQVFPGQGVRIIGSGDIADEPGKEFSRFFTQGLNSPERVDLEFNLDFSASNATAAQITLFGSPGTSPFLYEQSPPLSESFFPATVPLDFADAGTISFELVISPLTADGGPETLVGDLPWSVSGSYEKPFVLPPDDGGGGPAVVPLPAAVWLLGGAIGGLGGLSVLGRRKRRAA